MPRRKTTNEYRKELIEKYGKDLLVEGEEYKGTKTSILHICVECGNKFLRTPSNVLSGGQVKCPQCAGNAPIKTLEEAQVRVNLKHVINKIKVIEYAGNITNYSKFKCCECGYTWDTSLKSVIHIGTGCPQCAGNARIKTSEEAQMKVNSKHGTNKIEVIEYVGNVRDISRFKCCECGYTWNASLSNVANNGTGCPQCTGNVHIKTLEEAQVRVTLKHGVNKIEVIEYAGNVNDSSKFRCYECDYTWNAKLSNVANNGTGCPQCAGNARIKTSEEAQAKINSKHNENEIEIIEYAGNVTNYSKFKCCECGYTWDTSLHSIINMGTGCPQCSSGKFERKAGEILTKHNIPFETQYKFDGMIYKRQLKCDYVIEICGKKCIIETNGKQHYEHCTFYHKTKEEFLEQLKRDNVKVTYAVEHNIPLLPIHYWEKDNMEEVILNFIDKVTTQQITSNIGQLAFVF